MPPISGTKLAVDGEGMVTDWVVRHTRLVIPKVASNTKAGVSIVCGLKDWMGRYTLLDNQPLVLPGRAAEFVGSGNAISGVVGTVIGRKLIVTADMLRNAPIETVVEFEGSGAPVWGPAAVSDASAMVPVCSLHGDINILTGLDIAQWTLTMEALNKSYGSTLTNGYKGRLEYGAFTARAEIVVFVNDASILPQVGDELEDVMFFTAEGGYPSAAGYQFGFMTVTELQVMVDANPQQEEPVPYRMVWEHSATSAADGSIGYANAPDLTVIWPYPEGS